MARNRKKAAGANAGVVIAALGVAGAIAYVVGKLLMRPAGPPGSAHSAAFAPHETDKDNFDQTRHAGSDAMRDTPRDWDDIDEQLDASFPSSDPPSFNPGVA
jgi:hypothetical protein